MNRRQILVGALGASVLALPLPALAATTPIVWLPGTRDSRHALLVAHTIHEVLRGGNLYVSGELLDHTIPLTDPHFEVGYSDIMFHPTRGWRFEDSLTVDYFERGTLLGQSFMFSNGDYEDYFGRPKPVDYPDYALRRPHMPYSDADRAESLRIIRDAGWNVVETRLPPRYTTVKEVEAKLGRDAIGSDMRWLDSAA